MRYHLFDLYAPSNSVKVPNKLARQIAIAGSGLQEAANSPCNKNSLLKLIKHLGYVQQDPLQVVARAHDHILWSRNNNYRPKHLETLMEKDRLIFEHFCHDACVLPMDTLPYWKNQFKRKNKLFKSRKSRNNLLNTNDHQQLISRITNEGPLCSRDFKISGKAKKQGIWSKPAHKQTLDYLWLTGGLAVSKREKFNKYYDLVDRVYPQKLIEVEITDEDRLAWLTRHALKRLGFATVMEISRFWDATSVAETKTWCEENNSKLCNVSIEAANGGVSKAIVLGSNTAILRTAPTISKRIRIINPFDPIVRDRNRLERLFGFDYRIEIYVPPEKRRYGYYVYPLLEYDRFIGRLEVRHDRERNVLCVDNLWNEDKIKFGKQRMGKLQSELERLSRFCNAESIEWC